MSDVPDAMPDWTEVDMQQAWSWRCPCGLRQYADAETCEDYSDEDAIAHLQSQGVSPEDAVAMVEHMGGQGEWVTMPTKVQCVSCGAVHYTKGSRPGNDGED